MNQTFLDICEKYHIIYVEIIDTSHMTRESWGNINHLPYKGLYNSLLGDDDQIDNLLHMLKNGNEPYQTWRQGNSVGLCFIQQNHLICLFYNSEKRGIESFNYSQEVFDSFSTLESCGNVD